MSPAKELFLVSNWAEERNRSALEGLQEAMLNVEVIAKARGITPGVCFVTFLARKVLRKAFNGEWEVISDH